VAEIPGIEAVAGENEDVPVPDADCVVPAGGVGGKTFVTTLVLPEEGPKLAELWNDAVMVSLPTGAAVLVQLATPATSELVEQSAVVPEVKVTVPVGELVPVKATTVAA
jgi:hypothetical protein